MLINPLENWIFFSCDMIEFTIKNIKKDTYLSNFGIELCRDIDNDNSSNAFIDLFWLVFTYRKSFFKWWFTGLIFSTSIDKISVDCFAFLKWWEIFNWKQKSKDRVVFYSTFFVLEKMNKFDFSLSEFYEHLFPEYLKLYRIDICLDVPYTIKELQEWLFSQTRFFSQIGEDLKHPEFSQTYYIKNPQSSQNRSYIFRVYDKVLDTFKKWKWFLYPHLRNNLDVRRIELELRPKECITYPYKITDYFENKDNILEKIFTKYINKNISEEYHLDYWDIKCNTHYNEVFNLRDEFLKLWHVPNWYLTRAYWYIKKLKSSTWYIWLFDALLWVKKLKIETIKTKTTSFQSEICKRYWENINLKIWMINNNLINWYDLLDNLIIYLKKQWLSTRKINQILKKHQK